jgi:hypothetical protein
MASKCILYPREHTIGELKSRAVLEVPVPFVILSEAPRASHDADTDNSISSNLVL